MVSSRMLSSKHRQRGWAWLGPVLAAAGGVLSGQNQRKSMHEQMDAQREFAQMGIRWRVEDAKAAGVHPLYALGASTATYSPVSVGDTGIGSALQGLGQDVSSAYARQQTEAERRTSAAAQAFRQSEIDAQNKAEHAERLRGLKLENDMRQMDFNERALGLNRPIAQAINAPTQVGVPFPSGTVAESFPITDHRGRVDAGAIKLEPVEQKARDPHVPSHEAGSSAAWKRVEVAPGQYMDVPTWQTDAELPQTARELAAYWKKWVSDTFFGGAPKYIYKLPPHLDTAERTEREKYWSSKRFRNRKSFGH